MNTTLELVIGLVPGVKFERELDDKTGFNELKISQQESQQESQQD